MAGFAGLLNPGFSAGASSVGTGNVNGLQPSAITNFASGVQLPSYPMTGEVEFGEFETEIGYNPAMFSGAQSIINSGASTRAVSGNAQTATGVTGFAPYSIGEV